MCDDDNDLLWSNDYGWVSDRFDVFTKDEKQCLNLPINGRWVLMGVKT